MGRSFGQAVGHRRKTRACRRAVHPRGSRPLYPEPSIFNHIRTLKPGSGGELQLTDAIQALLENEHVLALKYEGTRFDCGSKFGYLRATVDFALRHPEVGTDFKQYLQHMLRSQLA
jgi:UTP--glucose-1-phosphate uridylyltransferase